nr:hypothetical protein [Tanacetum cinerariifolium]
YAAEDAANGGLMYAPPKLGRRRMCSIEAFGVLSANMKECGRLSSLKHFSKNIACSAALSWPGAAIIGSSGCVIGVKILFMVRDSCPVGPMFNPEKGGCGYFVWMVDLKYSSS